jgi:hypothetical protein
VVVRDPELRQQIRAATVDQAEVVVQDRFV